MARRVARPATAIVGPVLVLDAQGLSLLADNDRKMMARLELAQREGFRPAISTVTIVEQRRRGKAGQRLAWLRSRLTVVPVTEDVADTAAALLDSTGLSSHECVVDALVVATAASASGHAKVVSSDGSHIPALCKEATASRTSPVDWVRV
jgi:predicted nucleic acid-binding protein